MIKNRNRHKRTIALGTTIISFFSLLCLPSCKIYEPAYYFKDIKRDTIITGFVKDDLEFKIQKNDVLTISISSLNPGEDGLYNAGTSATGGTSGFLVDRDGNIYLHKIGKFTAAGLTRIQLKNMLERELSPFLKDPIATVNFANHRVTVFGDGSSKIVSLPEEKKPLLEIMAEAGGVNTNSKLNAVMVIRETGNSKEVKHLNLEDPSIFTSSWYYVQPNDIIVVKPNEEKISAEQKRTRVQLMYSLLLSAITFVFLIVDRVTR